MFESLNGKGNRFWTTAAGALVMSLWVAVLILIPLVYHQDISTFAFRKILIAPPRSQPVTQPDLPTAARISTLTVRYNPDGLVEPTSVQRPVVTATAEHILPGDFVDFRGVPGGMPGDLPQIGLSPGVDPAPPPPARPAPVEAADVVPQQTIRVRVGGSVQAARLIAQPRTAYPPLARQMRVQGTVRLEAVINMDGTVEDLRVISGHPLLVQAAIDSVSLWRYQPTLLNGEPVEVVTVIELNFTLAQ